MYIVAHRHYILDEFPPSIYGEPVILILLIPEDKFTDDMWEDEDFDPNDPAIHVSQPIPEGWRYKAVHLPGEVVFESEQFGPIHLVLTYRPLQFPHKAVREFVEKYGIE